MDRMLAGCAAITLVICDSTPGESAVVTSSVWPAAGMAYYGRA